MSADAKMREAALVVYGSEQSAQQSES